MDINQVSSEDNTSETSLQTQPPEESSQTPPTQVQVEETKDDPVAVTTQEQDNTVEDNLSNSEDETEINLIHYNASDPSTDANTPIATQVSDSQSNQKPQNEESKHENGFIRDFEAGQRLYLAFLHADPYVSEEENRQLLPVDTLSPDFAFKELVTELKRHGKEFKVLKSHLNYQTLIDTLNKKPKILVLNCHGAVKGNLSHFLFEKEKQPSLVDKYDLQDLEKLLQKYKNEQIGQSVKLVIVSACQSKWLADKFVNTAGIQSVIGIRASVEVKEKAAQAFNVALIKELVEGKTVNDAFETAKYKVSRSHRFCCCDHKHHSECPWVRYIEDNGLTAEEGHKLHVTDCRATCEPQFKHYESCKKKLYDFELLEDSDIRKEDNPCECLKQINKHMRGCKKYKEFYEKLTGRLDTPKDKEKIAKIQKLIEVQKASFLQEPTRNPEEHDIMCCCKRRLPHDESLKFVLKQQPDDKKENVPIFETEQLRDGDLTQVNLKQQQEDNKSDWRPDQALYSLYERNIEIHQIVDFIFARELKQNFDFPQYLAVANGENTPVKLETVIKQGVFFSIGRNPGIDGSRFLQIDLGDIIDLEATRDKISETLTLSRRSEASFIADLKRLQDYSLVYFSECKYLDDEQGEKEFLGLVKQIVDTTRYIKVIIAVPGKSSSPDDKRPRKFQSVEIKQLEQSKRYEFFHHLLQQRQIGNVPKDIIGAKAELDQLNDAELKLISENYISGMNGEQLIQEIKQLQQKQDQVKQRENSKKLQEEQDQEKAEASRVNTVIKWENRITNIPTIAEKNIVFLLNMFPAGLTEFELRKLCQVHPNWFGDYEQLKILEQSTGEQVEELWYRELIYVPPLNKDVKLMRFEINRQSRDTVANVFDKLPFIQWCDEDEKVTGQFQLMAIEFANQQARSYLLSILQGERIDNYQNYQFVTVQYDETLPKIEQPIERFNEYMRQNLENFIDKKRWLESYKGSAKNKNNVDELLSDLSLVLLSIEIELKPRNLDHLATKVEKYLALNEKSQNLLFYQLRLMQVSILVRKNKINSDDLLQKLFDVRKAFQDSKLGLSKSLAETYFIEAFIRMKVLGRAYDDEANEKINSLFQQAYEMYEQSSKSTHEDPFACDSEFGQAKVLLEQTKFFILNSTFDQEQFQTQIDKAKKAEGIFSARNRPDLEAMSIIQQVKLLLRRHSKREAESTFSKALDIQRDRLINDQSIIEEIKKTEGDIKTSQGKAIICILDQPGNITVEETQITDFRDSNRHWIEQLIRQFRNNKFDGRIIYEIISKRSLRKAIRFGAKILHVEQFVHKLDHLLVEDGSSGRLCQLDADQILKMIGADGTSNSDGQDSDFEKTLKDTFDCLVLAFPQSGTLAHSFKKLGVNHIVYFKSEEGSVPNDEHTIVAIQNFCLTFYQKLLEEFSVNAAFDNAKLNQETKSRFQPVLQERQVHRDKDLILNQKFNDYQPRKYQFQKVQTHYNIPNKKEKHQTRYEFYQTLYDLNPYKGEEKDEDDDDTKLFTRMIICKRYLQDGDKKDFLGICIAVHHADHESMKELPEAIRVFKEAGAQIDYVDRFKIPLMILSGDQAELQPTSKLYLSTLQIRLPNLENGVSIHVERVKEEIEQDQNMERLLQLLAKTQQLHSKEFNHRILLTSSYQLNTTPNSEFISTQASETTSFQLNTALNSYNKSTQGSETTSTQRSDRPLDFLDVSLGSEINIQDGSQDHRDEEIVIPKRDSQSNQKKLFESFPSDSNTNLIFKGQVHDLSFERCPFTNVNMQFVRLNGQQFELHEVLKFLTRKELKQELKQSTLLHVQDDRKKYGLSFLKEVAYCTLERDMIQRQIYYEDLSQIKTQQQLKNMLLRLHLDKHESELYKTHRQIQPVETLLLFENLDKLPSRLVEGFEIRLVDLLSQFKGVRCLTSSKEEFSFKQFTYPNGHDPSNQKGNQLRLIRIHLLNPTLIPVYEPVHVQEDAPELDQLQRDKDLILNQKFNDYRPRKYQFEKVYKKLNVSSKQEKHQTRYEFYQTLWDLKPYEGEEKDEDDDDTKLFTRMIICKHFQKDVDKEDEFLGICVGIYHTDHESMKALPEAIKVFKAAGVQIDYVDRFKILPKVLSGDQVQSQPTSKLYLSTLQIRLPNLENVGSINIERVKEEIESDQNMERLLQLLAKTQQLHSKEFNHRILLTSSYQLNTTPKLEDQSTKGSETTSYQMNTTPTSNFISTQGSDSRSERNVSQQNVSGNGGSQIDSQHDFGNLRDYEETKETKE